MTRRQVRALATVVFLSGSVAGFGSPAFGDTIRTTTGLGGFSVSANAAPFKVLIDDPSNPLPRPENEAIVEADPSFTLAEVATGPAARGVASTLWPGNLLGEGVGAASNGQLPGYPVKARPNLPGLRLHRCDGHLLAISSTELRERTRRNLSLDYFVPHKAIVYIQDRALYRGGT